MNNVAYFAPDTLEQAATLLGEHDGARVLAGGTDLVAKWKKSRCFDMKVVDIRNIPALGEIGGAADDFFIGAGVTMDRVNESDAIAARYPILAEAAGSVGSVQVRNMATIGGNACNAAPSADTVLPLIAYGAQALLYSKSGERTCPLEDFFTGPGGTVLGRGELLKGFLLPKPRVNTGAFFVKHSRRAGMDLATVGVALLMRLNDDGKTIGEIRLALGAVGPVPILVKSLNELAGRDAASEGLAALVADHAARAASPIDDVRGSKEYRFAMIRKSVEHALAEALKKIA